MEKIKLTISAAVEYKNVVYFSPIYVNGLFLLDLETKMLRFVCRFEEKEVHYALHRFACIYKNEIWFIPYQASKIAIVNMQTLEIEYISPLYHNVVKSGVKYRGGMLYCKGEIIEEKYLCLIPSSIDTVLLINLETREFTPFYDVIKSDEFLDGGTYDPVQHCIWMQFTKGENGLLRLDLENGKTKRYGHSFEGKNYGLYFDQGNLFMSPGEDHCIKIINTANLEMTSYPLEENNKGRYFWMMPHKEELWFLPGDEPKILIWDKINKKAKIKQLQVNFNDDVPFSIVSIPSQNKIIFTTEYTNCIYIYNETNVLEKIEVEWLRDSIRSDIEKIMYSIELKRMGRNGIYYENDSCLSLSALIDFTDILNGVKKHKERNGINIYNNTIE